MDSCKLCKIRNADKTGSHIIPHFLMKRIDNEIGKTERDREIGFTIGEMGTTSYFGQSVLPEKLNEIYGELSDKEIENNKVPMVVDHLFCTECETKFSQVETEYSKTIENKGVESKISSEISILFWISILWRVSVFKKQGLILKNKEEELLRRILNKYLTKKIADIDFEAIKKDTECKNLSYRLIRCPDYSIDEATYLFCHDLHRMPYSLLIDEYVLFFYFKKGHIDNLIQTFWGFENAIKGKILNTVSDGEIKILIDKEGFKECLDKLVNSIGDRRNAYYNWLFDELHKKMEGKGDTMPVELKKSILGRINSDKQKLGRKHTNDDVTKSIFEEIKKYTPK